MRKILVMLSYFYKFLIKLKRFFRVLNGLFWLLKKRILYKKIINGYKSELE